LSHCDTAVLAADLIVFIQCDLVYFSVTVWLYSAV